MFETARIRVLIEDESAGRMLDETLDNAETKPRSFPSDFVV